jgi:hypothetical protein
MMADAVAFFSFGGRATWQIALASWAVENLFACWQIPTACWMAGERRRETSPPIGVVAPYGLLRCRRGLVKVTIHQACARHCRVLESRTALFQPRFRSHAVERHRPNWGPLRLMRDTEMQMQAYLRCPADMFAAASGN